MHPTKSGAGDAESFGRKPRDAKPNMPVTPKQTTLSLFSLFSQIASISVVVVGVSVLLGWLVKSDYLKSVIPGLATMKANTAFAFLSAGTALWALRSTAPTRTETLAGRLLAALVVAIGALTLAEYIAAAEFGIDQLLFRDEATLPTSHPGRMAPGTALNFVLVGCAIFILQTHAAFSQWLAVPALIVSTLAVVGYAFGVSSLYQMPAYTLDGNSYGGGLRNLGHRHCGCTPDKWVYGRSSQRFSGGNSRSSPSSAAATDYLLSRGVAISRRGTGFL